MDKRYPRTFIRKPNADTILRDSAMVHACRCVKESRGPKGGVCGKCGGAILTDKEKD